MKRIGLILAGSILAALVATVAPSAAVAEEGMWTFDNLPLARIAERYGFRPDGRFVDHLRASAVNLAGSSASFVSPRGLIVTNHHVASDCVLALSSEKQDFLANGFYAATQAEERTCPGFTAETLLSITDVTDKIVAATRGRTGQAFHDALTAEEGRLEKACSEANIRCQVVELYGGGRYHLYRSRRYEDVRLVFSPEKAIADFGGDPDNFDFPRFDMDVVFLRAYEGGQPAATPEYLRWSRQGAKDGELSFVVGHPYATQRLLTVTQLEAERDVVQLRTLFLLAEARGLIGEYRQSSPEARRTADELLDTVENSFKARRGRLEALLDRAFFAARVEAERSFRTRAGAEVVTAFADIDRAQVERRRLYDEEDLLELFPPKLSTLLLQARGLVRAAEERDKPDAARLREYQEARLPKMKHTVLADVPVYPAVEERIIGFWLSKTRERLGVDHPAVKKLLGRDSPEEVAHRVVQGTKLGTLAARQALWEGGKKALLASSDPLIALVRALDPFARATRRAWEDKVEAPSTRAAEVLARARFRLYGDSVYPDATGTLRLSYGTVKGFPKQGRQVGPFTRIAGLYERATGSEPFALPPRWVEAKRRVDLTTPMNFVSTHDIIGGNSGSPIVNTRGELVGVIFDGNLPSLGGAYGYDLATHRATSVDGRFILHALERVYRADRLFRELAAR